MYNFCIQIEKNPKKIQVEASLTPKRRGKRQETKAFLIKKNIILSASINGFFKSYREKRKRRNKKTPRKDYTKVFKKKRSSK